jgi:hypothetical protein
VSASVRTHFAASVVLALVGMGCRPGNVCGEPTRAELGAVCASAEDCPRGGEVGVCWNDVDNEFPCVACEESACVQYTPVRCP